MIQCLLRWGQAMIRCFGSHPIPTPRMLLGASGDGPGATPLSHNPRSGAGVSHLSHNLKDAPCWACSGRSTSLSPVPPTQTPAHLQLCQGHGHIPWQAGDAMAGSALGLLFLGAWHHGTLLLNHSPAHVGQERPSHCHSKAGDRQDTVLGAPGGGHQDCPCGSSARAQNHGELLHKRSTSS